MSLLLSDSSSSVIVSPRRMIPRVPASFRAMPGLNAALSRRNVFNPDLPASVVGTPTLTPSAPLFGSFKGMTSYLDTGVVETDSVTFLTVVRTFDALTAATTQPGFVGNLAISATGWGAGLYIPGTASAAPAGQVRMAAVYGTSGSATNANAGLTIADLSVWRLLAGVVEAGVGLRIYDLTSGASATATTTATRLKNTAVPYRVGSIGATYAGTCDVALAESYPAALSLPQITAIAADIRLLMAARGITGI